ncbi:MAG: single-stranded DNA-binding protein [Alistipes sp.]|nr:single-stranded DNA-binding protein [Alistipes sp.]
MINKVILLGNVGQDPEVRTLETGVKVARLRLATTERIFNRQTNESTEHTEWHSITLWRGLAEVADKYVRKGSQIYVEGRIRSREWEKDGQRHFGFEIVADDMKLLGRRPEGAQQQGGYQQPQYQAPAQPQYQQGGYQQPQYQAPAQTQYQAPAQPQYQAPQYQPEPEPMPAAPQMPMADPDDLPF